MASYVSAGEAYASQSLANGVSAPAQANWADKYRGATVEDLDPPPALSVSPNDPISSALLAAYERDYTHLTVISSTSRSLLGYLSIPRLKTLLQEGTVKESDPVSAAMLRFNRKRGNVYHVITMETPLEELERFFEGEIGGTRREKQDFAVVTDASRKFVLGVATKADLEEFVKRRPA
ncbi:putative cystathionine beta-synthase [Thermoascus aurantiacus ATCC 26904]